MSGSGLAIGIGLNIIVNLYGSGELRATRKAPQIPMILQSQINKKKFIEVDRICAPTNIARVTLWERAARAK